MRGRAQPVDRHVMTPFGWPRDRAAARRRPRDRLRRPADAGPRRPSRRAEARSSASTAQDGASTLCCGEHLWFVTTPDDRKHGKPGGVLRDARDDRQAAPQPPAPLRAAGGQRAGRDRAARRADGSLRARAAARRRLPDDHDDADASRPPIPSWPRRSRRALPDIELVSEGRRRLRPAPRRRRPRRRHRRQPGHADTARAGAGGHALDHEVRAGARTCTTTPAVRLARPAGAARQRRRPGRAARPHLPDPVHDVLGAPARRRRVPRPLARRRGLLAATRRPRAAGPAARGGRPVHHRSDAYILDIRLPAGVEPFRLARKRDLYAPARRRAADAVRRAHRARRRRPRPSASRSPPPTRCT